MRSFRFRPRYRALPWVVAVLGLAVGALVWWSGSSPVFAVACALFGPLLTALYLASPAWRLQVDVDDDALVVRRGDEIRLRLPWSEVARVVASPATHTCFVDGGDPKRSLLVPGPGAAAPYRIERREELYAFILAHVPADKVRDSGTVLAS